MVAGNGWLHRDDFDDAGDDVVGLEGIPKGVLSPFVAPVIEKEQRLKRTVRNDCAFIIFQFFYSPFFN